MSIARPPSCPAPCPEREVLVACPLAADGTPLALARALGRVDRVALDCRAVAAACLSADAHLLLLAHSHPSGDPRPSAADLDTTRRLARALAPLGIRILDHVIVAPDGHFSFRAAGLL